MTPDLMTRVTERLRFEGLNATALLRESIEVVVFGSSSVGLATSHSDLDVLCVGTTWRVKTPQLDFIPISAEEIWNPRWLGSELAGHIAAYGIWIKGRGRWRESVQVASGVVSAKQQRVIRLLRAIERHRSNTSVAILSKHMTTIRRETLRYAMLNAGEPIPPTPMLDGLVDRKKLEVASVHLEMAIRTQNHQNQASRMLEVLAACLRPSPPVLISVASRTDV